MMTRTDPSRVILRILALGALAPAITFAAPVPPASTSNARALGPDVEIALEGDLAPPRPGLNPVQAARTYLHAAAALFPQGSAEELGLVQSDSQLVPGITHILYQQSFDGVPVYGARLVVSLRDDGSVFRTWGHLVRRPADLSVEPELDLEEGLDYALLAAGRPEAGLGDDPELIVWQSPIDPADLRLAWRFHLVDDLPVMSEFRVIDAVTGEALAREEGIFSAETSWYGAGFGVQGDLKSFYNVWNSTTGSYELKDITRSMYNASTGKGVIATYEAPATTSNISDDLDDGWYAADQAPEVDAHYYAATVYEYYRTTFGRASIDKANGSILSYTHYTAAQNDATGYPGYPNNATYLYGIGMAYGDGSAGVFRPLSGDLDVVAHELTHGVTAYGSRLVYQAQSGALNEALSDIMAKMQLDTASWKIGDGVVLFYPYYMRDMANPTMGIYNPSYPLSGGQPDTMWKFAYLPYDTANDLGGVHVNSGIINKMAYMMAVGGTFNGVTVPKLDRAVTAYLFYVLNQPYYLPTTADFDKFATAIRQVARDTYGAGSSTETAVTKALQSVFLLSTGCGTQSEVESNNSTSSANAVTTSCKDVNGSLSGTSDTDYFKVSVPAGKTVTAYLRVPYLSDFDLYAYSGSTLIASPTPHRGAGQDEVLAIKNPATTTATISYRITYYSGSTGTSQPYVLNLRW